MKELYPLAEPPNTNWISQDLLSFWLTVIQIGKKMQAWRLGKVNGHYEESILENGKGYSRKRYGSPGH